MIRFAVIGTNWITRQFVDAAHETGKYKLTAVYSRTLEQAQMFASDYPVEHLFTSLEALAQSDDIDAVYIATPNFLHFENVIAWWDRLDANWERRERYHELSRSGDDVPIDYGASANELFFPDMLNDVLEKQLRKGDFIDAIFYCPYDIHELVSEEYLSKILWELNEEHKELLFLCAVQLFSSTRIAKIRNQSDRNIRKVRGTMLKKIQKKLLPVLLDKAEKQQPMTLLEKDFLEESGMKIDSGEKK